MHDDTHVPLSRNMYTSFVVACLPGTFFSSSYAALKDMAALRVRVQSWSTAKHRTFL